METYEVQCRSCQHVFHFQADARDINDFRTGKVFVQDALPYVTSGVRELLLSRLCGKCYDTWT